MDNLEHEGIICLSDQKEKWLITCAYRQPAGKLETQSYKRMQRKYQAASVPVKTNCVVIDSDRTLKIEDPISLVSLGQWLISAGFSLAETQNWDAEEINLLGDGLWFYMDPDQIDEDDPEDDLNLDFTEEL